jgi:hypothetical protein
MLLAPDFSSARQSEGLQQRAGSRVGVDRGVTAPADVQGGHEHDHDCVVPRVAARLLSPRAALKQLDELELARHPPHPAAPTRRATSSGSPERLRRAELIVTHHGGGQRRPYSRTTLAKEIDSPLLRVAVC